jgi:hypothetical protein
MERERYERGRDAAPEQRHQDESAGDGERRAQPGDPDAKVDEAVEESFPASDPPAWTQLHVGGPDEHA